MSESMTVVEIEDVLSSIRRLVSEDLRPTHRLVSAALQKGASKLILTPALRIVSDVRTALPEQGDILDDAQDLGTVLNNIEVEEVAHTAQLIPVFGSVRMQDPVDLLERGGATDGDVAPNDANFLTTAMSRINGLASLPGDNLESHGASDRIESVVAAVGAAVGPDEWEVDGGDPAPQAKAWTDAVWANADEPDSPALQDQGADGEGDGEYADIEAHDAAAVCIAGEGQHPGFADGEEGSGSEAEDEADGEPQPDRGCQAEGQQGGNYGGDDGVGHLF